MTSFSDIFNTSFLILLGILVLAISLLFIYFESKTREQNHKINSMLSLVSSLAEETNNIKNTLTVFMMNGGNQLRNDEYETKQPFQINRSEYQNETDNNLIDVSDDDKDDDNDDDDDDLESDNSSNDDETTNDSDEDNDDSSDNNSELSDKLDLDNKQNTEDNSNDIKVLKLNLSKNTDIDSDSDFDNEDEKMDLDTDDLDNDDIISIGGISLNSNSEQIATDAILSLHNIVDNNNIIITLHNFNQQNQNQYDNEHDIQILDDEKKEDFENYETININKDDFKSININQNNLEDKTIDNLDYKKLPINKLRNIVVEKGLINDSSKLKKNELLKLLGIE